MGLGLLMAVIFWAIWTAPVMSFSSGIIALLCSSSIVIVVICWGIFPCFHSLFLLAKRDLIIETY